MGACCTKEQENYMTDDKNYKPMSRPNCNS